ncbi:MAG TPA: hypothetical protein DEB30_01735 [Candidatus Peribacter riflensis]|uniref:DUF5667 domain-containing protein n=1 Tax=Candidatus Peribacter riflensis TaxID=1735162 RepID=A0A0S1SRR5_9BACT|nr:MAG: Uncharacterized protein PeribacterA2_1032 [Candidatus Peribacter riflensis]OGJ76576.1 MAG: hypothetical protein A2398_04170 [Candidatus Peribacteria bacterium RIFOXYB1_FULL_57_12]OGJ82837.1 MAG: hypothetical protein A2412_01655 [Candidatus Peribacteria bacterium RIFOXYC1_FULL_58_8]ALM11493.1 MAG: Uncharacterized protein PeribacterB2_1034 [Candidatus Peribacter riflensis]ALM12595.1 MAG: Uncharacterized protein PeribacterC2_1033 [Candidatus Peribacter riflensis]
MDKRVTAFLAAARSCTLSPVEHAQVRAALTAHTMSFAPSDVLRASSGSLRLTDYEKAIGRAKLLSFMRSNPLEERRLSLFSVFSRPLAATLVSACIVLLAGGGMAYAAEGSMPGDLLYPIKVHITEPVISGLSITSARRAQWTIRTIERRLDEANTLDQESDSDDRGATLRSQMEENAVSLQKYLHSLPAEERKAIRRDLLLELTQHQKSLLQVQAAIGIPQTLKTLMEDAADELDENDRDDASSSSSAEEKQNRERMEKKLEEKEERRVVAPPRNEEERQEASAASSSAFSHASSSSEETSEILSGGERKERRENAARSLLRLLQETPPRSSAASSSEMFFTSPIRSSSSREEENHEREERKEKEPKEDGR